MDPSQENVRKRLLLLILANSKKKWRKKRKFVREKEKEKKKSVYTEENPIPVLIDCVLLRSIWYNLKKRPHFLTYFKPTLQFWPDLGQFWLSWLNLF